VSAPVLAGAAILDVTPPPGLPMAGFVARTAPAVGAHDLLTVRALAVGDTVVVAADVMGLHEDTCRRIRLRAGLPDASLVVTAVHTHGGPRTMPGRLGGHEREYLARLEDACVEAVRQAWDARRPAFLFFGQGEDPGIARNRRHPGGPVDPALPVLRVRGVDGGWIAVLAAYACHPVVLGPDNLLWTADYPGFVRRSLEADHPGAIALFLTGCTADANTGHTAQASLSRAANPDRTYVAAERHATRVIAAARAAPLSPLGPEVRAATAEVALNFERRETLPAADLARGWRAEATATPERATLLKAWAEWAETIMPRSLDPWVGRVSVFGWGGLRIVFLPGEIFARTALDIRAALDGSAVSGNTIVVGFADGCPGYIPPIEEFAHGGYEVDEAHRYYGLPAAFAPGSAERLAVAALALARSVPG
jgi:hypothetical protein